VCVKDFGLHNQNIDMIIFLACLVGWLYSSPVEIKDKSLYSCLGLSLGCHEYPHDPGKQMCNNAYDRHNPWHTV